MTDKDVARFRSKIVFDDAERCWLWKGTVGEHGYGTFWLGGKYHRAHRVAYLICNGEWPEPCCLHSCDTPLCVNFRHLSAGTVAENNADMLAKDRQARGPRPYVAKGERHHHARLTWALVREARFRFDVGGETITSLARDYSVNRSTLSQAIHGQTWREYGPREAAA